MAKKKFNNGDPIVTPQPSNPNSPKMTGRTVERLPGGNFKKVTKTKMINTPNEQTSSTKTKTVHTLKGAAREIAGDVSYGLEKAVGKISDIKKKREEKASAKEAAWNKLYQGVKDSARKPQQQLEAPKPQRTKAELLDSLRKGNSQEKEAALKYSKDAYDAINFKNKDIDRFSTRFGNGKASAAEIEMMYKEPKP